MKESEKRILVKTIYARKRDYLLRILNILGVYINPLFRHVPASNTRTRAM